MSVSSYDAFDDPNCYKGNRVLKGKARLRDADLLSDFELEMTALRAREPLPDGNFDPAHYRALHRHLFQDVYAWGESTERSARQREATHSVIQNTSRARWKSSSQ